jgi:hypothetical protein
MADVLTGESTLTIPPVRTLVGTVGLEPTNVRRFKRPADAN